ncbi:hypothetical protein [Lacipirellula sp.]|uniref:hypothetical protein n=1 Tax=Lacipirellula sp. TaxID=2691419 RepID=UPI003D12C8AE
MTGKSETVSFRLDHDMVKQLSRCADLLGVSRGEYAKRLVIEGLTNSFAETAKSLLLAIRHDLSLLREEHLTSTNALLVTAGKMTPDKAVEFIDRVMLKKSEPDA